jgi:hypothetical protein
MTHLKHILKLSLAAVAVAGLAACGGGGGSSEAADIYVGTWKSKCYSYTGNDGNTYYQTHKANFAKASAAELALTYTESKAHSDSACANSLGATSNSASARINLGTEEGFLGAPATYMVYTIAATGEARQGYIKADATQLLFVVSDATGQKPGGWSRTSPYTKQ